MPHASHWHGVRPVPPPSTTPSSSNSLETATGADAVLNTTDRLGNITLSTTQDSSNSSETGRERNPTPLMVGPSAAAVLRTNELLETILVHLPPTDITRFKRVSKAWQALIMKPRLVEAQCLKPLTGRQIGEAHERLKIEVAVNGLDAPSYMDEPTVYYDYEGPIKIHSIFDTMLFENRDSQWRCGTLIHLDQLMHYEQNFQNSLDDFATFPRCQDLLVRTDRTTTSYTRAAEDRQGVLSVEGGVRVRDLLEVGRRIHQRLPGGNNPNLWYGRDFAVDQTHSTIGTTIRCSWVDLTTAMNLATAVVRSRERHGFLGRAMDGFLGRARHGFLSREGHGFHDRALGVYWEESEEELEEELEEEPEEESEDLL